MIAYCLQVFFCWALFYLIYHLALRKETFFMVNRWYLLTTLFLGLIIPFAGQYIQSAMTLVPLQTAAVVYEVSQAPLMVQQNFQSTEVETSAWIIALSGLYFLGIFMGLVKLAKGLFRIHRLYQGGSQYNRIGYKVIETTEPHLPFSFLKWVFISKLVPLPERFEKVLEHEKLHVKQWHTIDVLFLQLIHIVFWFNPILILYKKALQRTHEYLADRTVLKTTNKQEYGLLLLGQRTTGLELALTHQFFNTQIKNRIQMMYQKQSKQSARWKYSIALPGLLLAVILFSNAMTPLMDVDRPALYPGCDLSMEKTELLACAKRHLLKDIYSQIKYPVQAREAGISGIALVKIEVDKIGQLQEPELLKDPGYGLGDEALRIINALRDFDNWEPAIKNDRAVSDEFLLPIAFKLVDEGVKVRDNDPVLENGVVSLPKSIRVMEKVVVVGYMSTSTDANVSDLERIKHLGNTEEIKKVNPVKPDVASVTMIDDAAKQSTVAPDIPEDAVWFIDGEKVDGPSVLKELEPDQIETMTVWKNQEDVPNRFNLADDVEHVVEIELKSARSNSLLGEIETDKRNKLERLDFKTPIDSDVVWKLDGKVSSQNEIEQLKPEEIETISVYRGKSTLSKDGLTEPVDNVIEVVRKSDDVVEPNVPESIQEGLPELIEPDNKILLGSKEKMDPIYIVDGERMEEVSWINPDQIQRIDVVKGEKALDIAGEEGKERGVVIIHMKKGVKIEPIEPDGKILLGPEEKTDPIYMVDGERMEEVSWINPDQIQRIDVVKGEKALDIAGEEGKERGVVIIHTKKGVKKKPNKRKQTEKSKSAHESTATSTMDEPEVLFRTGGAFLKGYKAFPNPAADIINVSFASTPDPITVQLWTMDGKNLYTKEITDFNGQFNEAIEVPQGVAGYVLLDIRQGNRSQSQKILVSNP